MAKLPGAIQGARIVGDKFVHAQRRENPEGRMPLVDHIRELRNRIVKAAAAGLLGMVVGVVFFDPLWRFATNPYCKALAGVPGPGGVRAGTCDPHVIGHALTFVGPLDGFYMHIKLGIVAGLVLSSPVWLYQLWSFIAPGLYAKEKKYTYVFVGAAVPLFVLGFFFAMFVMGRGLHFLMAMVPNNSGVALFTADTYFGYFFAMILGFGLCFELPLLLVMLNMAGILTHARFRKWRRVMIFLVFVFAGIASPSPDPITMLMLGGVCVALVEGAEVIILLNDRRRARRPAFDGLSDEEFAALQNEDDLPADD
jgi:sec-independent protein translocase protein TatC